MRSRLNKLQQYIPVELATALYQETEVEATEVKKRTPVDTGALRASVHVEGPFREGLRIWTDIVAGGPAAPYAYFVHEDPDAFHEVGDWKFIESVLYENAPVMIDRIARRVDINRSLEK